MTLKKTIIDLYNKSPYIKKIYQTTKHKLGLERKYEFPAGHYYSSIVSLPDIRKREAEIWANVDKDGIVGIDLKTNDQVELVKKLAHYYPEMPFKSEKNTETRYNFENPYYFYTDAIILYSMIRHFKPNRIIEIGSGFSSALILDTNEHFFNNKINLTFVEPNPERLFSLMTDIDKKSVNIIQKIVQQTPPDTFSDLQAGDILFIDSTHVAKTGSDLNYIIFEILPHLKSGVLIHFHDIFYPFEYPKDWVLWGRNWNEDYFLRAFLMYNNQFEIKLFSNYLHKHHKYVFNDMPLCQKDGGSNLWIEKK